MSKIKHILSVIHYTICGAVCLQFTHFPCGDWENIYTLSYYHHQIGSMNYYPLLGLGHETILSAVFLYSNPILIRCVRLPISISIPYSDTRQLISVSTETNTKWQPNLDTFITIPIYMRPENVIILNGRQNLRNLATLWVLTSLFDDRIDAQAINCQASNLIVPDTCNLLYSHNTMVLCPENAFDITSPLSGKSTRFRRFDSSLASSLNKMLNKQSNHQCQATSL